MKESERKYQDIINHPHFQSVKRPHMSLYNRAAQFAPFAALVGYDDLVQDTADMLLNEKKKLLSEDTKQLLDMKLQILRKHLADSPVIEITYYDECAGSNGGLYCIATGRLKKIEDNPSRLILEQNVQIPCSGILYVDGQIFEKYFD